MKIGVVLIYSTFIRWPAREDHLRGGALSLYLNVITCSSPRRVTLPQKRPHRFGRVFWRAWQNERGIRGEARTAASKAAAHLFEKKNFRRYAV